MAKRKWIGQSPTNAHDWNNAENWDGGVVPVSGDDVVFDGDAKSELLYGLEQMSIALNSITICETFPRECNIGIKKEPFNG